MKGLKILCAVALTGVVGFGAGRLVTPSQPEKNTKEKAIQPEDPMAEMMRLGEPSDEHKMLAKMIGTWDCTATFQSPGPDGNMQEMKSKGVATFTSELDGRWIRQDFQGEFNGMPFVGIGIDGYDRVEKKFVASWRDNFSTTMMVMTGTHDPATKTITYSGEYNMPGGVKAKTRHVLVATDDDHVTFTMYRTMPGTSEVKEGELKYVRRK